jgi:hypothetical protein
MRLANSGRGKHGMNLTGAFLFTISIFIVGCFHGEKITQVQPGMSIEEVKSIMGPQEGYKKIGEYEIYSYYNKLISGWAWDKADYHYIVKDGKVVEYGAGEIRQNQNTGVVFIVPLGR